MERRITRRMRRIREIKTAKMDLDVYSLLCDKLKIRIEDLETEVSDLETEVSDLEIRVDKLEIRVEDLEEELSTLQEENYIGVPAPRSLTEELELEERLRG